MVITRRRTFKLLAAGGLLGLTKMATRAGASKTAEKKATYPWEPRPLNPARSRDMAYKGYYNGGCCYGAFYGLLGQLATRYGSPYDTFPMEMMIYGKSGVAGFGTLCGTLNGSAAAFGLMFEGKARDGLISELFNWYASSHLPLYTPAKPKLPVEILTTRPDSLLCHLSATLWCEAAGKKPSSPERTERCARLAADVAGKATELLNQRLEGVTFASRPLDSAGQCLECHGKGKDAEISKGNLSCTSCHGSKPLHRHILQKVMPIKKRLGLL